VQLLRLTASLQPLLHALARRRTRPTARPRRVVRRENCEEASRIQYASRPRGREAKEGEGRTQPHRPLHALLEAVPAPHPHRPAPATGRDGRRRVRPPLGAAVLALAVGEAALTVSLARPAEEARARDAGDGRRGARRLREARRRLARWARAGVGRARCRGRGGEDGRGRRDGRAPARREAGRGDDGGGGRGEGRDRRRRARLAELARATREGAARLGRR